MLLCSISRRKFTLPSAEVASPTAAGADSAPIGPNIDIYVSCLINGERLTLTDAVLLYGQKLTSNAVNLHLKLVSINLYPWPDIIVSGVV